MTRRSLALGAVAALSATALLVAQSSAEIKQSGTLRVAFEGKITPQRLPRKGLAPVAVSLGGRITTSDSSAPPQLRRVALAINRLGRIDRKGLTRCHYHQIEPATTLEAKHTCRSSLVGHGFFQAHVALPEQSPFPSDGEVLAFNGVLHGKPVIFAHIYGTTPLPQSRLLAFEIRSGGGRFGTSLIAHLPQVAAEWGYVSGIRLTLNRSFRYRGRVHNFISAGCPAPPGINEVGFPLAKATFGFEDGKSVSSTLVRSCTASG